MYVFDTLAPTSAFVIGLFLIMRVDIIVDVRQICIHLSLIMAKIVETMSEFIHWNLNASQRNKSALLEIAYNFLDLNEAHPPKCEPPFPK